MIILLKPVYRKPTHSGVFIKLHQLYSPLFQSSHGKDTGDKGLSAMLKLAHI